MVYDPFNKFKLIDFVDVYFIELYVQLFVKAVEDIKVLKQQPNSDELLEIYALYKQATVGNVNTGKAKLFLHKHSF